MSLKPPVFVFGPFRLTLSAVVSMDGHLNIPPLGRGAPSSACGRRIRRSSSIGHEPINHSTIFIEASQGGLFLENGVLIEGLSSQERLV